MLERPKPKPKARKAAKAALKAARDQRHRLRRAQGRCCIRTEIDDRVIAWLVRLHHLPPRESYSVAEIEQAVRTLLWSNSRDC